MNNIKLLICSLSAIIILIFSAGCSSSSDEPDTPTTPDTRSVLVYMVANNNLSYYASLDFAEIKEGANDIKGGRLLVYYHTPTGNPELIEVMNDGSTQTLKTYDTSESSVSIARMSQVMEDVSALDKTRNLGLIFWSHGTGWLNDSGVIDEDEGESPLQTYSFGADNTDSGTKRMKISSLRKALEGNTYDFIYFDCCHMATVEVAYELRKLTPVIAGCPTELGLEGMPYQKNITHFFATEPDIAAAIKNTFDFYVAQATNGCCISVINTSGLDRLAELSREAMQQHSTPSGYTPVRYYRTSIMSSGIYDMKHYFKALLADSPSELVAWEKAYNDVVTTTYTTATVYSLDASNFSGLGCNIISSSNTPSKYGYTETSWYNDVVK